MFTFNEEYFNKIDTPEKAYILGFLYADGNVDQKRYCVKIVLHNKDTEILLKIRASLESNHNIVTTREHYSKLTIVNKKLSISLIDKGCLPNKSNIIQFPSLLQELEPHFIRGYFDGDGCINIFKIKEHSYERVSIVSGSDLFIKRLILILKSYNIKCNYRIDRTTTFVLTITKKSEIQRFFELIYKDSTIHLDRKYNLFRQYRANQKK